MFNEKITLVDGILLGGQLFTEAVLAEETFKHTLQASKLPGIDVSRLDDEAYYAAALFAVRLTVPGLFETRMKHDPAFKELVEEYAEAAEVKIKQVTAAKVNPVSAEIVEGLSRFDGRLLLGASAILVKRRADFRKKALATPDGHLGPKKAGVHGGRGPGEKPGGDKGDL